MEIEIGWKLLVAIIVVSLAAVGRITARYEAKPKRREKSNGIS